MIATTKSRSKQSSAHPNDSDPVNGIVVAVDQISNAVHLINTQVNHFSTMVEEGAVSTTETAGRSGKLLSAAESISSVVKLIECITGKIHLLALNANIEAARAGEAGRGFSVVADEVKALASQVAQSNKTISEELRGLQGECQIVSDALDSLNQTMEQLKQFGMTVASTTEEQSVILSDISNQTRSLSHRFQDLDSIRLMEMSQTLVQLIVRNLYERTADVRWWATDDSLTRCFAKSLTEQAQAAPASQSLFQYLFGSAADSTKKADPKALRAEIARIAEGRLRIINSFYSVYLNLVLFDLDGNVIASSQPERFPKIADSTFASREWFRESQKLERGDEYVAAPIYRESLMENRLVSVYAARVAVDGTLTGEIGGVLGVFFDWEDQARVIVEQEPNLSAEEWNRSCVMLLDSKNRIIACSDPSRVLEAFPLSDQGRDKGYYVDSKGQLVAFARTIGYQEYSGLGWKGVITQLPKSDA